MELTNEILQTYHPGQVYSSLLNDKSSNIPPNTTSLDFEPISAVFLLACQGHQLTLFNSDLGVIIQKSSNVAGESGAVIAKFTRRSLESTVILAPNASQSDTLSYALRCYSLLQNSTITTFVGHSNQVCSIQQSPGDDCFVTGDVGGEVRLWDVRDSTNCIARVRLSSTENEKAFVAIDASNSIMACANGRTGVIRLFSLANLGKGPIKTFDLPKPSYTINNIAYSPNNKLLLVTTEQERMLGLDPNEGQVKFQVNCISKPEYSTIPTFSADSKYISIGGTEGPIIFNSEGQFVHELRVGGACNVSKLCLFSPKTELLVSSGEDATVFWKSKNNL